MNKIDVDTIHAGEFPHRLRVRAHTITLDASTGAGGQDSAPGPHDLFDGALAACKAITAIWYAKRHGIPLERVESHVESDDSEERAGKYIIRVHVELIGPLTDEQRAEVQRAIARCPIHKLMTTSEVTVETVQPGTPARARASARS